MTSHLVRTASSKPSGLAWVRPVLFAESVLFPLAFLLMAGTIVRTFLEPLDHPILGARTVQDAIGALLALAMHPEKFHAQIPRVQIFGILAVVVLKPLTLFFFSVLCAVFIAWKGRLRYEPGSLREILVPIAGTTIFLLFPISDRLPPWLGRPFSYPPGWAAPVFGVAGALSVVGALVMLHGLLHLRRSFSVFVEVREIVLSGLYRYVRHPLYAGEILLCAGLVLMIPSLFGLVLFFIMVVFQYARARMEEGCLAAASPEYAKRLAVTGMFFPRFRPPRLPRVAPAVPGWRSTRNKVVLAFGVVAIVVAAGWITARREETRTRPVTTRSVKTVSQAWNFGRSGGDFAGTRGIPSDASGGVHLDLAQAQALLQAAWDAQGRGDWDRAVELYGRVVEGAPEAPRALLLLGFCLLQTGDLVRARNVYEEALRRMPDSDEAANGLSWTLLEAGGSVQRAVKLAEFATGRSPTPHNYDTLARAYVKAGDCERGKEAARKVLELKPDGELYRALLKTIRSSCR